MRSGWKRMMLVITVISSCSTTRADYFAERERLLGLDQGWTAAIAAEDVDGMVACLAEDAHVAPSGFMAITSKAATREYVLASLQRRNDEPERDAETSPAFPMECKTTDLRFSPDGELAYMLQSNTLSISGGSPWIAKYGQGTKIWRKQSGGYWKCVAYSWSSSGLSAMGY